MMKTKEIILEETAFALYKWMSEQTYKKEPLLHPAVCCDYVGYRRFLNRIKELIEPAMEAYHA